MISTGFAFLSPTPEYETNHLYIVISIINNIEVLFVNVTTKKKNSDTSCILTSEDHDFIIHDSVINYADAKIAKIENLQKAIDSQVIHPQKPVSISGLERIQKGALNSNAFPQGYLKYIPDQ